MVGDEAETPDDSVALLDSVLVVVSGPASVSDSGNIVLRSVVDEKEEAECMEAAGRECMGNFRKLIVERRVTVSSCKTITLSSNFEMPYY